MKNILIILSLFLTACGTITVQANGNKKSMEYRNPPYTSYNRATAFAMPSVQSEMTVAAMKECPGGYSIQNQRFDKQKDALVWNITCLEPQ